MKTTIIETNEGHKLIVDIQTLEKPEGLKCVTIARETVGHKAPNFLCLYLNNEELKKFGQAILKEAL